MGATARSALERETSRAADQGQGCSKQSLRALDWLNFVLADVQTGVGPFLAIYLAGYAWDEQRIGLALSAGGIAGILAQTSAGALVDQVRHKRTVIAIGVGALALGALLIAFLPTFWPVISAQVLIGATSSIFIPAICAISLGIVGHQVFDTRQGRNQAFNSAGNVVAAVSRAFSDTSFPTAASSFSL
jgi:MFS family permease